MKSFQNVFNKLDKIVRQSMITLFKLTDFYLGFYRACLLQTVGTFVWDIDVELY